MIEIKKEQNDMIDYSDLEISDFEISDPEISDFEMFDPEISDLEKKDIAISKAMDMAFALSKNYTWDAYSELVDFCCENDVFFYHDEIEKKIYIEDDWFYIGD